MVPISYSPRDGQHHHNLRSYKGTPSSTQARWHLVALLHLFLRDHLACIGARIGHRPTHVAVVPSSRKPGQHPLTTLVNRLSLPMIPASANPAVGVGAREFRTDWFAIEPPPGRGPVHALVIDDTWTSGAHAQSLAYALKEAGAATVAVVILGRHVNPEYGPSGQLLSAIRHPVFDVSRCAAEPGR